MRFSLALALLAACGTSEPSTAGDDTPAPDASASTDPAPRIPTPTGTCPTITAGDVTFAPVGMAPRKVKLAFDPGTASDHGELLLYWHATGSSPLEAGYSLGATQAAFTARGGIVATPYSDASAGTFEWFVVNGSAQPDDFLLSDEIVACLAAAHRIDPRHIHAMGMSAGALQTTALSFARSSYIASVVTYSGGLPAGFSPTVEDPANKFAALIFDGGTTDSVFGVDFKAASEAYQSMLSSSGHYTSLCDHGMGHEIPLDAAPAVAAFFTANPYGAWPSPYAANVPATFPSYCAR